jgi:biopolymer transport protein ExbB
MIDVFAVITAEGVNDTSKLAGGIWQALVTTAAGLSVAIPTLIMYRYFRAYVNELVLKMEDESLKMIEVLHGSRSNKQMEAKA